MPWTWEGGPKVFEGESKQYYTLEQAKGFRGFGGIDTLFKKDTGNAALDKRFSYHVLKAKNE